jgi:SAM-dependent methyltransferase
VSTFVRSIRRRARSLAEGALRTQNLGLVRIDDPELEWRSALVDESNPLPGHATERLRADHPRLVELRQAYAALDWPVVSHSRWQSDKVDAWLDLRHFRGDNSYVWHYRESRRVSELKFFVFLEYVRTRDERGLLEQLGEDGAYGCWTYRFADRPRCSRDLLDAVNELGFLDREVGLLDAESPRVLDIGAGYGRLAHRTAQAAPKLADYCCVDAVPQSTFLSEYYAEARGVAPPVRVVALPDVPDLEAGSFDLACNVHSFSECPVEAIRWWMGQLARLEVPHLFLVPNEPSGYLSMEPDGTRLDYLPVIEAAGYHLVAEEPAFTDPAVAELLGVRDRHCLFRRR